MKSITKLIFFTLVFSFTLSAHAIYKGKEGGLPFVGKIQIGSIPCSGVAINSRTLMTVGHCLGFNSLSSRTMTPQIERLVEASLKSATFEIQFNGIKQSFRAKKVLIKSWDLEVA